MKMDLNLKDGRPRKIVQNLRRLGLAASLVLAAMAYERANRQQAAREAAIMKRVPQVVRDYYLLRQLGDGKTDEVRQMLSFELADNLRELRTANILANPSRLAWVDELCLHILHDEFHHPEYFLTASNDARVQQERAWTALQQGVDMAKAASVPLEPKTPLLDEPQND